MRETNSHKRKRGAQVVDTMPVAALCGLRRHKLLDYAMESDKDMEEPREYYEALSFESVGFAEAVDDDFVSARPNCSNLILPRRQRLATCRQGSRACGFRAFSDR